MRCSQQEGTQSDQANAPGLAASQVNWETEDELATACLEASDSRDTPIFRFPSNGDKAGSQGLCPSSKEIIAYLTDHVQWLACYPSCGRGVRRRSLIIAVPYGPRSRGRGPGRTAESGLRHQRRIDWVCRPARLLRLKQSRPLRPPWQAIPTHLEWTDTCRFRGVRQEPI